MAIVLVMAAFFSAVCHLFRHLLFLFNIFLVRNIYVHACGQNFTCVGQKIHVFTLPKLRGSQTRISMVRSFQGKQKKKG